MPKLLLTSCGVTNRSIREALVDDGTAAEPAGMTDDREA